MQRKSTILTIIGSIAFLLVGLAIVSISLDTNLVEAKNPEILQFDVAEDFTKVVFNTDIIQENGFPDHGSPFITQGYIYPEGTLNGTDGVNDDGSAEFPEKVIGTWICRGWIFGDITNPEGKPTAVTTQIFQFGDEYGNQTIISDGFEYMEPGNIFTRAIIGGTGDYRGANGELTQEILGVNENFGMALRYTLELDK